MSSQSYRPPGQTEVQPASFAPGQDLWEGSNAAAAEALAASQENPDVGTWPPPSNQTWFERAVQWGGDTFLDGAEGLAEGIDSVENAWDTFWDDPTGMKRAEEDRRAIKEAEEKYGPSVAPVPGVRPPVGPPPPPK